MAHSCVLLLRGGHCYNPAAILICRRYLDVLAVAESDGIDEVTLAALRPDVVISFLNDYILRGPLLLLPGVNFHPAPPEYPGRGGASRALFDGAKTYGATAHIIQHEVDTGPIIEVERFERHLSDDCHTLYANAEYTCIRLLERFVWRFAPCGKIDIVSRGQQWSGCCMTGRQFQNWLLLDPTDRDAFVRKIDAARHPTKPGPFVDIHGFKFGLAK